MSNKPSKTTYLKEYQPPVFLIDNVDLDFDLQDNVTYVQSSLKCRRNEAFAAFVKEKSSNQNLSNQTQTQALVLQGENLKLLDIALDGKKISEQEYVLDEETLTIANVPDAFTLTIKVLIHPEKNTELSGLYRSKQLFCTQCEAEGFRRITFFQDRPDVMSKFKTTIRADKKQYPVLLSNGNCVDKGDLDGGRHFVTWEDPYKKPCYLFALVAGNLIGIEDHFVTQSGRLVTLKIYVEWENQDKCAHAMAALKSAMKWDEETYGREYDLDIYMIVAVNDFNMGAMENKGLNIFNSKYILARGETATDFDFEHIDVVVGHEYFHNWSGNRVTCRDWFQLSLKEGLTVFREHHFSSDLTKSAVSLIQNAARLRAHQFAEDAGPMAHPVRPASYVAIDNFYTSTVYEKGAEVIRMIKTILGPEKFRQGMDLYFDRHDGQAVTCDDFVNAMEAASKIDLSQFRLWYSQAGTPELEAIEQYDANAASFRLTLKQSLKPTPGQSHKQPMHIPVAIGLLDKEGQDLLPQRTVVLQFKQSEQVFQFDGIKQKPILSLLREFSAPVKVKSTEDNESLAFLLSKDSDHFIRWDSGQKLSERLIGKLVDFYHSNKNSIAKSDSELPSISEESLTDALKDELNQWLLAHQAVLKNSELNPALKVALLTLPSSNYLIEQMTPADPDAIFAAKKLLVQALAKFCIEDFLLQYRDNITFGPYQYSTEFADKRALKNLCLGYLLKLIEDNGFKKAANDAELNVSKTSQFKAENDSKPKEVQELIDLAMTQWRTANNMTDAMAVVSMLADVDCNERIEVLAEFYDRFQHDPLVLDKWLRVQATSSLPDTLAQVQSLMKHPAFSIKNPNKVYSLIGGFAGGNLLHFHHKNGKGYQFLADAIIELNALNPQIASRMLDPFTRWQKFDVERQNKMRTELLRIKECPNLSKDVLEIVLKSLGEYQFT